MSDTRKAVHQTVVPITEFRIETKTLCVIAVIVQENSHKQSNKNNKIAKQVIHTNVFFVDMVTPAGYERVDGNFVDKFRVQVLDITMVPPRSKH